jgi:hypothetical protein
VVCASREIEPKDMAPVTKRLTISTAGSTRHRAARRRRAALDVEEAANGVFSAVFAESFTISAKLL